MLSEEFICCAQPKGTVIDPYMAIVLGRVQRAQFDALVCLICTWMDNPMSELPELDTFVALIFDIPELATFWTSHYPIKSVTTFANVTLLTVSPKMSERFYCLDLHIFSELFG